MRHVEQRPALLDEVINVREETRVRHFVDRDGLAWVSRQPGKVIVELDGAEQWNLTEAVELFGLTEK